MPDKSDAKRDTGALEGDLQLTQQELKEITLLLEQSQSEVEKLTHRNATVSAHLQQVQSQMENIPPADIGTAYDAALEAQQRLTVMRGQLEKLQSDKLHVEQYLALLQKMGHSPEAADSITSNGKGTLPPVQALIQAQETERERLSRQMHDGPAQALSNFVLQAEIAMRLFEVDPEKAREELDALKNAASATFEKVRDFITELRPISLDEVGLASTIESFAAAYSKKAGIEISVSQGETSERVPNYIEVLIFRSVQELVSSPVLHEHASAMTVRLDIQEQQANVVVESDGRGFDPLNLPEEAERLLSSIRERVEILSGKFDVSGSEDESSRFSLSLPVPSSP
jgi:two-component system sensor histidine kinase DegS